MASQRENLRRRYNELIVKLQRDGHAIKVEEGRESPEWAKKQVPSNIEFIAKDHVHFPTYYRNASLRFETVASLLKDLHGYYKRRFLGDAPTLAAVVNLQRILHTMVLPSGFTGKAMEQTAVIGDIVRNGKGYWKLISPMMDETIEVNAILHRLNSATDELEKAGILELPTRRKFRDLFRSKTT